MLKICAADENRFLSGVDHFSYRHLETLVGGGRPLCKVTLTEKSVRRLLGLQASIIIKLLLP